MLLVFGAKQQHELCPDGATRQLSQENKQEFVDLYVNWFLNTSVQAQFDAFWYVSAFLF